MESEQSNVDDGTTMDVILFNAIGFYRLLQPSSYCDLYRKVMLAIIWLCSGIQCMQIVRIYLVIEDIQQFPYVLMLMTTGLICTFKGYVMLTNADRVWAILDATRYGFTSCGHRNPSRLHRCRNWLAIWLRKFVVLGWCTVIIWMLAPWLINGKVAFVKLDGNVGHYPISLYNFWYPISESAHNRPTVSAMIYTIEMIVCATDITCMFIFDCFLVTIGVTLHAQIHTLAIAYDTFDHQSYCSQQPSYSRSCIQNNHMQSDYYNDLIVLIKDNQKIIKRYEDFFDIIRPIVLVQIIIGSYTIVTLIFFTVLGYLTGLSIISAPILKLFFAYASFVVQLYIYCYVLNLLDSAKSTLIFGLYSCNWTEMDFKFKKALLLAMNMNSIHMRMIRVSPKSIISLEMFARVMQMSFSIVSVLLNIRNKNPTAMK